MGRIADDYSDKEYILQMITQDIINKIRKDIKRGISRNKIIEFLIERNQ